MKIENKNRYYIGSVRDFEKTRGYIIGQFMGARGFDLLETEEVEIAWKKLPQQFDESGPHFHKRGVEINIVIQGHFVVNVEGETKHLYRGDFLVVYPETAIQGISSSEDAELLVVKAPSVPNDKFDVM